MMTRRFDAAADALASAARADRTMRCDAGGRRLLAGPMLMACAAAMIGVGQGDLVYRMCLAARSDGQRHLPARMEQDVCRRSLRDELPAARSWVMVAKAERLRKA